MVSRVQGSHRSMAGCRGAAAQASQGQGVPLSAEIQAKGGAAAASLGQGSLPSAVEGGRAGQGQRALSL